MDRQVLIRYKCECKKKVTPTKYSAVTPSGNTILFFTNRKDRKSGSVRNRFTDRLSDNLSCGLISRTNKKLRFDSVTQGKMDCGRILQNHLGRGRALVYIHGFNNLFVDAIKRGFILQNRLSRNQKVVVWSWPSTGELDNYGHDKGKAFSSAVTTMKVLNRVSKHCNGKVSVLAHSLGAASLLSAIQIDAALSKTRTRKFEQLVFAAPDVGRDIFNIAMYDKQYLHSRMSVYTCARDYALLFSKTMNGRPPMGILDPQYSFQNPMDFDTIDSKGERGSYVANHSVIFHDERVLTDLGRVMTTGAAPLERGLKKCKIGIWHFWIWGHDSCIRVESEDYPIP